MDTLFCSEKFDKVTHGRGYVYSLQYHIVWCVKYRKKLFEGALAEEVKEHLARTSDDLNIRILAMEVMPDHGLSSNLTDNIYAYGLRLPFGLRDCWPTYPP